MDTGGKKLKRSKSWGASHVKQKHNVAVDKNVKLATKHLIKLYKSYTIDVSIRIKKAS